MHKVDRGPKGTVWYRTVIATIVTLATLVGSPPDLSAQSAFGIPVQTRVRLTLLGTRPSVTTGRLVALDSGLVRIRACASCAPAGYRVGDLSAISISDGRSVSRQRLLIGLAIGAAAGAGIGAWHGRKSDRSCPPNGAYCGVAGTVEPIVGGVLGGLVGMIPAFAFPVEHWKTVWRRP